MVSRIPSIESTRVKSSRHDASDFNGEIDLAIGREIEPLGVLILAHVAAGLTDAEIGERLELSVGQVRYSFRVLMERIGAINRSNAVAIGFARQLLVFEDCGKPQTLSILPLAVSR